MGLNQMLAVSQTVEMCITFYGMRKFSMMFTTSALVPFFTIF